MMVSRLLTGLDRFDANCHKKSDQLAAVTVCSNVMLMISMSKMHQMIAMRKFQSKDSASGQLDEEDLLLRYSGLLACD
jgi:formate-dependent nitrite reductase cytochrome c552 subunit